MKIVPECYANQCLALVLKHNIKNLGSDVRISILHNYRLGRDRILKFIEKYSIRVNDLIVALIDYEKGVSRTFIDHRFELSKIKDSILLGKHKYRHNILAIVFDPNIEEALLCKHFLILCRNLEKYFKKKPLSNMISETAEIILHGQQLEAW